jgi:hypothetical protein
MKNLITALVLCAGLFSCAKNDSPSDDKTHILAAASMESEQLSLAGEQLLSPHSFMLADRVFDMALAKNPNNVRARFYKELIRPQMLAQGYVTRTRNLMNSFGDHDRQFNTTNELPNSSLKDFLLSGTSDINNETQMQDFLVQYRTSLFQLYNFLKQTEKTSLVLNLNPILFYSAIKQDYDNSCVVKDNSADKIEVVCDHQDIAQRKLNQADMIALRQIVGGAFLYTFIYTNYSAEGAVEFFNATHDRKDLSPLQTANILRNIPRLGNLRSDNAFHELTNLGADLSSSWKFAIENHSTLCPSLKYGIGEKRHSYLFNSGLCVDVDSESQKNLALLNDALAGPVTIKAKMASNEKKDITIDPFLIAKRPISDLKRMIPTQFNECKQATAFEDPTFGGILLTPEPMIFNSNCRYSHE